ncbi:hypothetical protein KRX19_08305 [Cardiobacteriaceae bacterium TAE3-ERU3]|nr:hypothetical protein [Cardiobacteriaceae bacterium TAE3-ERU3]
MTIVYAVAVVVILAAMLCAVVRVVLGPRDIDRVIALDVLLAAAVMLCVLAGLMSGRGVFVDVAVGLALVAFIGTVGWALILEKNARRNARDEEAQS